MAPWLRWAFGLVALCAAAGVLIAGGPEISDERAARLRMWQLRAELNQTNMARVQWATLAEIRPFVPERGIAVELDAPLPPDAPDGWAAPVGDSARAAIASDVRAELDARGAPRARVAVVMLPHLPGAVADANLRPMAVQYFAGADSLGGWCAVALSPLVASPRPLLEAAYAGGSALGPCRWWAAYGAPGPAIAGLLPDAGYLLAGGPSPADGTGPRRRLFGMRSWSDEVPPASFATQACLAGRTDTCVDALFDAGTWWFPFWTAPSDDAAALFARSPYGAVADPLEHFFADLERELGVDAFARLWRAQGDAENALSAALGEDAGGWIRNWARARLGVEPKGPTVEASTLLLSLAALGLLVQAAILVARRRSVA